MILPRLQINRYVVIVLISLVTAVFASKDWLVTGNLRVHFPLYLLKSGQELLNPSDTASIWEYYLLENLSCGLVRDAKSKAIGYEGCLSDRFFQANESNWTFHIRSLKWSDGSDLSAMQINRWFGQIVREDHRHIRYLRDLKGYSFDEDTRLLSLDFNSKVDDGILHELSLADAALVPDDFKTVGWKKTVGPYFVANWDSEKSELHLKRNPYSPLGNEGSASDITLFYISDPDERENLFSKFTADLVPVSVMADPKVASGYRQLPAKEFVGHPTHISFFYFNRKNRDATIDKNRAIFAKLIRSFASENQELIGSYGWSVESQMIPDGFKGRLEKEALSFSSSEGSLPSSLRIVLPTSYKAFSSYVSSLTEYFQKHGTELTVDFAPSLEPKNNYFAGLLTFVGNQMDPSGSWSFLTSPGGGGVLHDWLDEVHDEYSAAFSESNRIQKERAFKVLHGAILARHLAVPVTIGSLRYFYSDRIDLSGWNKFDSRLRLYEIK